MSIGLLTNGVRHETDPALALLDEHVDDAKANLRVAAIVGLGIAYAGTRRQEVLDRLLPLVSDTSLTMEISSMAALSLGLVFTGTCNGEITSTILQTMMEREEAALKDTYSRMMGLGLALLFIGRQEAAEATVETLKVIENPIAKAVGVMVEIAAYAGTGNVLQIQKMLHYCNDHLDPEETDDRYQAFAVLGIAMIAMGEEIGSEMAMRSFNHLVCFAQLLGLIVILKVDARCTMANPLFVARCLWLSASSVHQTLL